MSLAGDDTPPSSNSEPSSQLLVNELEQTKTLLGFYQNESEFWQNVHKNESINVSNQYLIETKNNISYINQQVIEINQTIINIENKIQIIYFAVLITLFESLFSITMYIRNYLKEKNEEN